jgi:hypothetical protein
LYAQGTGPLTVGTILNAAFDLYRRQLKGVWAISALIVIPAQVLVWIMIRVSLSSNAYAKNGAIYASSSAAVPTVAILLLGFLSAVLAEGALSRLLGETYTDQTAKWQESLGYASTKLLPLVLLAVVWIVGVGIGITLFLVPGIFLAVAWSVSVPVLMLERVGPLPALSRSWQLVGGLWWTVFGAFLVAVGIVVGVSLLVDSILGAAASSSSIDVILTLAGISRAVAAILTYPLLAAVAVVVYVGLRAQKEGTTPAV